jgi:hydroxymethylpyrimidine pyrophosphatase-like HAD family hydrolase
MNEPGTGAMDSPRDRFRGLVVSDLDGTLLRRDHSVSPTDLETLVVLGSEPVLRVIATGRSLYSARNVLPDSFPIDYLIFSSGAGILDWRAKSLVQKHTLSANEVARAVSALKDLSADFMIHRPVPDNHYFVYYHSGRENPDFARRCDIYRDFAVPADYRDSFSGEACEVLAVEPPDADAAESLAASATELSGTSSGGLPGGGRRDRGLHTRLAERLDPLKIIRATSPIDGLSTWVEIFPHGVSKASAAEWIALREGLGRTKALALGNDYNDLDLLDWAPTRYVVANAPASMLERYPSVGHHDENAFTEAVMRWRNRKLR